jgi:hypothetical protein
MIYIYTVCYNTPHFIEIQYQSLKKYIKDSFEYIVFNNTMTNSHITQTNIANNNELKSICDKKNIVFYNLPKNIFQNVADNNASLRAGIAIDYSNKLLFNTYDLSNTFFLIDSDAFLITEFNVNDFMQNKKLSGRIQLRQGLNEVVRYITNQIVIYKPSLFDKDLFLNNFSFLPCTVDGIANCDCGGKIHNILKTIDNDNDFINWTNKLFSVTGNNKQLYGGSPSEDEDFNLSYVENIDQSIKNLIEKDTAILNKKFPFCEIFGNDNYKSILFLHLRAGTNWINYNIEERNKNVFNFFQI